MTVIIRGRQYVTVAERVTAANEQDGAEFSIVGGDIITVGNTGRWWYQATIRVRNRCFIGTAEIKFNARAGTADADSPLECAETSAIGRALAFAGIGSAEDIASADEVARAASETQTQTQQRPSHGAERGTPAPTHSRVKFNALSNLEYRQRAKAIGYSSVAQIEELLATVGATPETASLDDAYRALHAQEAMARKAAHTAQHSLKLGEPEDSEGTAAQ